MRAGHAAYFGTEVDEFGGGEKIRGVGQTIRERQHEVQHIAPILDGRGQYGVMNDNRNDKEEERARIAFGVCSDPKFEGFLTPSKKDLL